MAVRSKHRRQGGERCRQAFESKRNPLAPAAISEFPQPRDSYTRCNETQWITE
jgi:hypothetical protein